MHSPRVLKERGREFSSYFLDEVCGNEANFSVEFCFPPTAWIVLVQNNQHVTLTDGEKISVKSEEKKKKKRERREREEREKRERRERSERERREKRERREREKREKRERREREERQK